MTNMFANVKIEDIKENVEVRGAAGFYKPGVHKIVDTTVYIYETEWNGNKFTNATVEFVREDGAKLGQELFTKTKSNQKDGETDLTNFMGYVAIGTGREEEFAGLKAEFATLPVVDYTNKYKKTYKAKMIKVFANARYSILTTTELAASDAGIFTSQILDLRFVFRAEDNASVEEIKSEDKDKFGTNFEYWSEPDNTASKISIAYSKGNYDNWDERSEREVKDFVTEAVEYFKDGGSLSEELPGQTGPKNERERVSTLFMEGMSCTEVKERLATLKAGASTTEPSIDDIDEESTDLPFSME